MNFQVTGLGLDKMKLDSPQSFLDQEEVEEAEDGQLLEPEAWRTYVEHRNALQEFLTSDLSPHLLKRHHARMELLKKCSYYIEILPKHLALGDQNPLVLPTTMFQLIDPWKFQRMKKVGAAQTKIQLLLLGDLLEQLDHGRSELDALLESPDPRPFLAGWGLVEQRLADLSAVMDSFLAMMVPGRLHVKHRLVSDIGATKIPHIRLMLSTKMPVVFDRKESVAHQDWVSLRWLGMHLELGYSWAAVGDALPQFGKMRQAPLERLTPHGGHPLRILESGHWTTLDKSLYLSEL